MSDNPVKLSGNSETGKWAGLGANLTLIVSILSLSLLLSNTLFNRPSVSQLIVAVFVSFVVCYSMALLVHSVIRRIRPKRTSSRIIVPDSYKKSSRKGTIQKLYTRMVRFATPALLGLVLSLPVGLLIMPSASWRYLRELRSGNGGPIVALDVTDDKVYLATGSWDYIAHVWRTNADGHPIAHQESGGLDNGGQIYDIAIDPVYSATTTPDSCQLNVYTVTRRGELIHWRGTPEGSWTEERIKKHSKAAVQLELIRKYGVIVTAGQDGYIRFTDCRTSSAYSHWKSLEFNHAFKLLDLKVTECNGIPIILTICTHGVLGAYQPTLNQFATIRLPLTNEVLCADISPWRESSRVAVTTNATDGKFVVQEFHIAMLFSDGKRLDSLNVVPKKSFQCIPGFTPLSLAYSGNRLLLGYYKPSDERKTPLEVYSLKNDQRTIVYFDDSLYKIYAPDQTDLVFIAASRKVYSLDLGDSVLTPSIITKSVSNDILHLEWLNDQEIVTVDSDGCVHVRHAQQPSEATLIARIGESVADIGVLSKSVFSVACKTGEIYTLSKQNAKWSRSLVVRTIRSENATICHVCKMVYLSDGSKVFSVPLFPGDTKTESQPCPQTITAITCTHENEILVGTATGSVYSSDFKSGFTALFEVGGAAISSMVYDSDTRRLITVNAEGNLQLYVLTSRGLESLWPQPIRHAVSLAKFIDSKNEIAAAISGYVITWIETKTGERIERFGHGSDINAFAVNPSGNLLAVSWSNYVRIYERFRPLQIW